MKNKKILKPLLIILLITVVLTWLIPGTQPNQMTGEFELGATNPEGILSIFGSFDIIASYFFQNMLVVLFVGMFYGIINKTGAYKELIEKIAKSFKKKKEIFLILTIAFFILFPAFANLYFLMFLFVPFFMHVLKELDYKKNIMLLATVGSILIGLSGQIASNMYTLGDGKNPYIWIKVGFLVISTILTVLYALKFNTNDAKDEDDNMLELAKRTGKKIDTKPKKMSIVFIVMFIFFLLGFIPWKFNFLSEMQTAIMEVSIGKFQIFKAIFGTFNPFGAWHTSEFYALLSLTAILIAFLYKLSFDDFVEGLLEGIKAFLIPALLVALMSLVTIFTINSGFMATVIRFITSTGKIVLVTIGSLISAPFAAEPGYIASYNLQIMLSGITEPNVEQISLISQLTYGILMLFIPTSSILVAGLTYTQKDYKSWIKYIWKLGVVLLILVFIAILISTLI